MISRSNSSQTMRKTAIWIALLGLLLPSYGAAQVAELPASEIDEVAIDRGSAELRDAMDIRDRDLIDTALVFTNISRDRARVGCHAFNADGEPVGRVRVYIPGGGLRFVFASDFGNSVDFVGHVNCKTSPRVRGSAVLLAPHAITDLAAHHNRRQGTILFSVVANR